LRTRQIANGKARLELSPGKYLFSAGVRNKNGDAYIFLKPVQIQSKETVELTVNLDIPMEQLLREDLVVRELEKIPDFTLKNAGWDRALTMELTLSKELQTGNVLLVFFTLDNEPCKSMLPRIERTLTAKDWRNMRLIYIFVGMPDSAVVSAFIAENKISHPILLDEDCAVAKKFNLPQDSGGKFTSLPSIILMHERRQNRVLGRGLQSRDRFYFALCAGDDRKVTSKCERDNVYLFKTLQFRLGQTHFPG
jgi:peroxiredoxin